MSDILLHLKANVNGFEDLAGNEWTNDDVVVETNGKFGGYCLNISNGKLGAHTTSLAGQKLAANEDWTIALWSHKTNYSTWDYILSFDNRDKFALQNHDNYADSIGFRNGSNSYKLHSSSAQTRNQWVHIAVVNSSGTMSLYVGGVKQGTTTSVADISLSSVYIGNSDNDSRDNKAGLIDDLLIIKQALWSDNFTPPSSPYGDTTENETGKGVDEYTSVLLHFDESTTKDECGNEWSELPITTASSSVAPILSSEYVKFGENALSRNGGRIASGITLFAQNFTFDFWAYLLPCAGVSGHYETYLFFLQGYFTVSYDNEKINIYLGNQSSSINASFPISAAEFHHLAFVYLNDERKLQGYLDGIKQVEIDTDDTFVTRTDMAIVVTSKFVGSSMAPGLCGAIDEFRVSNGIARWSSNFIPPYLAYGDEANLYSKKLHMRDYINGLLVEEAVELFDKPYSDNFTKFFDASSNSTLYADVVDVNSDFASRFRIKRNNQIKSLLKMKTIDSVPQLLISEADYKPMGNLAFSDNPDNLFVTGDIIAAVAGNYHVEFTPKYGYKWFDGTLESKFRYWKINKVSCNASISTDSVFLDNSNSSQSIALYYEGSGELSVTSNDTSIATVSVTDGAPPGYEYVFGTTYKTITITGKGIGSCKLSVFVAADNSHFPSDELEINVDAEVYKPLSECTPTEIQSMIHSGKAHKAWKVGDCTSDITLTSTSFSDSTSSKKTTISGAYQAFILGFNHNNELEDEGKPSVHFALALKSNVPVAFCDGGYSKGYDASYHSNYGVYFIHKHSKTASNTNGWSGSYLKSTILPKFFNALPSDWQAIIQPCTKWTDNSGNKSTAEENVTETSDYLWLLSEFEVFGTTTYANEHEQDKQSQYEYFFYNSPVFYKHNDTSTVSSWWLRSPDSTTTTSFVGCDRTSGQAASKIDRYSLGIVPCFSVK